jgi:rhomboid protease GluP
MPIARRTLPSNDTAISDPTTQPRRTNPYTITYSLMAANILVFLAMIATGISFTSPSPQDVFNWGGDFAPATIGAHQYWRLLTSTFLHFGIIHIAMNMYVLYQIGPFIQTSFGRARYLLIYFAAGLAGSMVSVWVHPNAVGAGASGAIFGLYGALFGYLLLNRRTLDPNATKSIAKSAGIFVIYNVIYGTISGTTDLSAHLGGLVAGFLVGAALEYTKRPSQNRTVPM